MVLPGPAAVVDGAAAGVLLPPEKTTTPAITAAATATVAALPARIRDRLVPRSNRPARSGTSGPGPAGGTEGGGGAVSGAVGAGATGGGGGGGATGGGGGGGGGIADEPADVLPVPPIVACPSCCYPYPQFFDDVHTTSCKGLRPEEWRSTPSGSSRVVNGQCCPSTGRLGRQ
jgi:hypothetical protein